MMVKYQENSPFCFQPYLIFHSKSLSLNFPSHVDRPGGGQGVRDLVEVLIMVLMVMRRVLMIRRPVLYFASFHIFASRRERCLLVPLSPYRIHSSSSCRAKEIHSDKMECFHSQPFFFNSNYSETNTLITTFSYRHPIQSCQRLLTDTIEIVDKEFSISIIKHVEQIST